MLIKTASRPCRSRAELAKEAEQCRRHAAELANRPEEPFLLRLAEAFDELARGETPLKH